MPTAWSTIYFGEQLDVRQMTTDLGEPRDQADQQAGALRQLPRRHFMASFDGGVLLVGSGTVGARNLSRACINGDYTSKVVGHQVRPQPGRATIALATVRGRRLHSTVEHGDDHDIMDKRRRADLNAFQKAASTDQ